MVASAGSGAGAGCVWRAEGKNVAKDRLQEGGASAHADTRLRHAAAGAAWPLPSTLPSVDVPDPVIHVASGRSRPTPITRRYVPEVTRGHPTERGGGNGMRRKTRASANRDTTRHQQNTFFNNVTASMQPRKVSLASGDLGPPTHHAASARACSLGTVAGGRGRRAKSHGRLMTFVTEVNLVRWFLDLMQ